MARPTLMEMSLFIDEVCVDVKCDLSTLDIYPNDNHDNL